MSNKLNRPGLEPLDTRQNTNLPRDAVYLGFGWKRLAQANLRPDFKSPTRPRLSAKPFMKRKIPGEWLTKLVIPSGLSTAI